MKIYSRVTWDIETGKILDEESFEYEGALALCDRGQEKAAATQQGAQSATDQANAQSDRTATNQTLSDYQGKLSSYLSGNPYVEGGEFSQNIDKLGATVSAGEENSAEGAQNSAAARTGVSSSPQLAANASEMKRESTRSLGNYLANAEQDRIAKENSVQQFGVQAALAPADVTSRNYGTSVSGATGTGANQVAASHTPGFWDNFGNSFAKAAGNTIGSGAAAAGG